MPKPIRAQVLMDGICSGLTGMTGKGQLILFYRSWSLHSIKMHVMEEFGDFSRTTLNVTKLYVEN